MAATVGVLGCGASAAAEFDRATMETCLAAVPEDSSGSECLVPLRHQCNSLLDGGTMQQDIGCLQRAVAAVAEWSDEMLAAEATGLTAAQVADYRRRLRGFCLGQMTRGDTVDEVAMSLCELAGHAALHRDILRRSGAAE